MDITVFERVSAALWNIGVVVYRVRQEGDVYTGEGVGTSNNDVSFEVSFREGATVVTVLA